MMCGAVAGECHCKHDDPSHEGPHECEDTEKCNGAWEDRLGEFQTVRLPGFSAPNPPDWFRFMFGEDIL